MMASVQASTALVNMGNAPMNSFMSNFRAQRTKVIARQHRCSVCDQVFSRAEHLARHERSHRGEKPFQCSYCDVQFTRKDLIKRHVRRQHAQEAENAEPRAPRVSTQAAPQPLLLDQVNTQQPVPDLNYGPILNWNPGSPNSVELRCQPTIVPFDMTDPTDVELNNLMCDIYYNDGDLDFQSTEMVPDIMPESNNTDASKTQPMVDMEWNAFTRLTPDTTLDGLSDTSEKTLRGTFDISEPKRLEMISEIEKVRPEANVSLPSCLSLERFVAACFDSLYSIVPCVHLPTWRAEDAHPCLLLAMSSCGAKYCKRDDLALTLHRIVRVATLDMVRLLDRTERDQPPWLLQTLFLIICFGAWSGQKEMAREALAAHSLLAELFRSAGAETDNQDSHDSAEPNSDWEIWVAKETAIRTRYLLSYYLSLVTVVYNYPPILLFSEIDMSLPCNETQWAASTARDWEACRKDAGPRMNLTEALHALLDQSIAVPHFGGTYAAIIVLHAFLQQVWFWRQDRWNSNPELQRAKFASALHKWEMAARLEPESSIPPYHSKASLLYSAHALLRMARVYLCANMGNIHSSFVSHNVQTIARAMATQVTVERSPEATMAAIHAARSLRVPLRFGTDLNSGCGTLHYYFTILDCGLYLSRWLATLQKTLDDEWTDKEKESFTLVQLTLEEVDIPPDKAVKPLAAQIAYACAMILGGINTWGITPLILKALNEYANNIQS